MPTYNTIEEMILATADAVRPPERISVSEAAERYHIVKNPGQHEGPFSLDKTPYLREPMDVLTSLEYRYMTFAGPARTGKALALDTPIPTPDGWTTMGELSVGDRVFDERGEICRVTATTEVMHNHDCYRVEFDDGASIVADAGHKWGVIDHRNTRKPVYRVWTTQEMRDAGLMLGKTANAAKFKIPVAKPLATESRRLPIDPYFLGVWLGDGACERSMLTLHEDDTPEICAELERRDFTLSCREVQWAKAERVTVSWDRTVTVASVLRELGLLKDVGGDKHIPQQYLRAGYNDRLALLRGLMDTDGSRYKGKRTVCYSTMSDRLASDIVELCISLGFKTHCKKFFKDSHRDVQVNRITFTPTDDVFVFNLERYRLSEDEKVVSLRTNALTHRSIRAIETVTSVPVRCITVDSPSHLFLAGKQMVPTHNSAMAINWLAHTAITDPADIMVIQMTMHTARDWSQADLGKALRNSPELKRRLTPGRQNDNVYDKHFLSGMRLLVTWPTISNLSGKTIPRLWLMDYDRMPLDVDGEGIPFDLAAKRMTTFGRYGMCAAEASPGYDIEDPKWMANDPHEAPPTKGILSLYNRGDRRRWYWACPHCASSFQPQFKLLVWPNLESKDIMEMAEQTEMACPHCGGLMRPNQQRELNRGGKWVKSGQVWHPETDTITGTPRRSDMASFWMFGPAAGFTDWPELVKKYLNALNDFEATGDEGPLRTTVNVDQGEAYLPKTLEGGRLPETLKARAEDWGGHTENGEPLVPEAVRFLVATIDVQAGGRPSFVVHVFGIGEGFDIYHIDMFKITKSERVDEQGDHEGLDPASHIEDWDLLISEVLEKSYPLNDQSGRRMAIKIAACDSGGKDGVTANAYDFYRKLRSDGQADRFHLVKGSPSKSETAPIRVTYPNAQQKDRFAIARGDVPVWLVNSNIVKDQVSNMLGRDEPGGQIHFPRWSPDWLYSQLTTEIRMPSGEWKNPSRRRNEAFDLLAYCVAICDHPDIRIRFLDWQNPPIWAAAWDDNPLVFGGDEDSPKIMNTSTVKLGLEDLGSLLG